MKIWEIHRIISSSNFNTTFESQEEKVNLSEVEAEHLMQAMSNQSMGYKYVKICNPMGGMISASDKKMLIQNQLGKG